MNLDFLKIQNQKIKKKLISSFTNSINQADYILGHNVNLLEKKLSSDVGSKYCCVVSSGTDALYIALKCLDIKKGDEVITSPFSWISAVEMIVSLGAIPVFCDIDPLTFNLNPLEITKKISNKTKAILPVSLFGQICDIQEINKIAKKFKIKVIEDAAQSYGSSENGINSCNCTDLSITSFFPTKPLGTLGDGGAIFTNNKKYYEYCIKFRNHGQYIKGKYDLVGVNSRLDNIKAGFLIEKLKIFKKEVELRQNVYKSYCEYLENSKLNIQLPFIKPKTISVFAQFPLLTSKENRQKIISFNKISKKFKFPIFYPKPIYELKPYSSFRVEKLEITEMICKTIFCLPFHPYMKPKELHQITNYLKKVIN